MVVTMKSMFIVLLSGQIERAQFPSLDNCYCKYSYVYGNDWEQVSGLDEGLSAKCERASSRDCIVIGLPIEATFTSTNPFRWPQLLISCYGSDSFGNDVVRGYGAVHIPTIPGRCVRRIAMFVPEASTSVQKFFAWITGKRAEFVDPRIVASADGRHVTRVRSQGFISVTMNVVLKDLKKYGYDVIPSSIARISEFPLPKFDVKSTADKPSTSEELPASDQHLAPPNNGQQHITAKIEHSPPTDDIRRPLPLPRRCSQIAQPEQTVEELETDQRSSNN